MSERPMKFIKIMFSSDPLFCVSVRLAAHELKIPEEKILRHLNKNPPLLEMLNQRRIARADLFQSMMREARIHRPPGMCLHGQTTVQSNPVWDKLIEMDKRIIGFVNQAKEELMEVVDCPECEGSGEDLEDSSRDCFLCQGLGKMNRHRVADYGKVT